MEMVDLIVISKADPITNNESINNAEIHIKQKLPKFNDLLVAKKNYQEEAKKLNNILKTHLPQATRHELLILLLQDTQNLYRGI